MKTPHQKPYLRTIKPEEQRLYDHMQYCVQSEPPSRVLERFYHLFIDGQNYTDLDVDDAIRTIVKSRQANQEFTFIINQCCHLLINYWQTKSQLAENLPRLVELLTTSNNAKRTYSRHAKKLRSLVVNFTKTEAYRNLERLAQVCHPYLKIDRSQLNFLPLKSLINRYPYLYKYCLVSENSEYEYRQTIQQIEVHAQRHFEFLMAQYVTYQVRLAEIARQRQISRGAGQLLRPIQNPTLLESKELAAALKKLLGSVQGDKTYGDLANIFISHNRQGSSYQVFKEKLYAYLASGIDSGYKQNYLQERLFEQLKNIFPEYEQHKSSSFLTLRTCSKLLDFFIIESQQQPQHHLYIDLTTNLGINHTVGILLKIVLLCPDLKPFLAKKLALLFNYYESSHLGEVPWLFKSLETFQLAFSIYFGKADLSYLKQIMPSKVIL